MCRLISFLYKFENDKIEIILDDLLSHSETQKSSGKTETNGYFEGHYLPTGDVECRTPNGVNNEANASLKYLYPTFVSFFNYCLSATNQLENFKGDLDVRGCDLKGVKLPTTIGGSLDVSGCKNFEDSVIPEGFKGTIYK